MSDKLEDAQQLLDQLYERIDSGGLTQMESGMFEVLAWICEDTEKPELD